MRTLSFQIELPRRRRRAVELYSRDTPFRGRVQQTRVQYRRRAKHVKKGVEE